MQQRSTFQTVLTEAELFVVGSQLKLDKKLFLGSQISNAFTFQIFARNERVKKAQVRPKQPGGYSPRMGKMQGRVLLCTI